MGLIVGPTMNNITHFEMEAQNTHPKTFLVPFKSKIGTCSFMVDRLPFGVLISFVYNGRIASVKTKRE